MTKDEFLRACESHLGPQSPGETLGHNRWRRGAGGGRFENRGIVRWYSENCIQIALTTHPSFTGIFDSPESALEWLCITNSPT